MCAKGTRILALDPGTLYMGVAVLEGERLLYYGVRTFCRARPAERLFRATRLVVGQLIEQYQPAILAYEHTFYVQQQASAMLHIQEREIARLGRAEKLKVIGLSPAQVRRMLCQDGRATKQQVADLLVRRFPEIAGYRHRGEARREKYWLNMFDAVAVAVVAGDASAGWNPNEALNDAA